MPAAAVIPAPRAYINVVAVKKPVVGFERSAFRNLPEFFERWIGDDLRPLSETCGIICWPRAH